ncbi:MAG: hypothetical protein A3F35_01055 [Candidatus Woykebacteria bacterium RIFCSPHIGHO2_12_FULL_45_10]|uniref:Uncharacterized protein n=1 Tax=Candidatus Woykebacteria bacterium RIFCSPHIGHO2_12_FULL_45_10 TaxID=1802603 RepID=A0A1G1WNX4_9BACT|nr:MAG: hypothetical protein A3F35_01055 [Candidatus Woykebacteria bacterium RIFCSPHIGHO2_12_FULL_45_10]
MQDPTHWRQPILTHGCDYPIWFRRDGLEMQILATSNPQQGRLLIEGAGGYLEIWPIKAAKDSPQWGLRWKVGQSVPFRIEGSLVFTDQELSAAFGLIDYVEQEPDCLWVINQFGGNSTAAGKFLRWKEFLNIPGPGTGRAGDPNLSVRITQEMKDAVLQLLTLGVPTPVAAG